MFGFKKLCKDYDVADQSGFAGTHGLWATHNAVHKKTGTQATVWVLEKKPIEKAWFKKDAAGLKKLLETLRLDALPPSGLKAGPELFEKMEDDSSYMVFVTERVIGSLLSLYYQLGDLTLAKNSQFSSDPIEAKNAKLILRLTSPDTILYGLTAALRDLSALHEASVVHGSLTPANLVVTPTGEWRICGFGFSENTAFQFDFNADYNSQFRPAPAFMSPKQVHGHVSSLQSDTAQLFNSIFAVFGNRVPHFDWQTTRKDKVPSGDQLVAAIEKLTGVCPSGTPWAMAASLAGTQAQFNQQFWSQFAKSAVQYYPLQYLQPLCQAISVGAGEQATAVQMLKQFTQINKFVALAQELADLQREDAFTGRTSTELIPRITALLTTGIPTFVKEKFFTMDFIQSTLFERLIGLMSNKDYHQYLIPLLINMNEVLLIPNYQLFLVFEPIVISTTMSKYRSLYPAASKSGPLQAFTGITLDFNGQSDSLKTEQITVKYTSPYNDIPLEPKMREKDRERFCPNFDRDLDEAGTSVFHQTAAAIYKNLFFFFSPKSGGRSHYYTLNFVMGAIACQNNTVSGDVLKFLSDQVVLFTEKNWMAEETQLATQKALSAVSNAMSDIGSKFNNMIEKEQPDAPKKDEPAALNYKQPITAVLTPCIGTIVKTSSNQLQMMNALICLGKLANFFSDEQIGRVMLPNINDALDNIQKYPKAIVGFAEFCKVLYKRCSARTLATMFLPRLMRMCFVPDLMGADLEVVRATSDILYQVITEEVYKRVQETYNGVSQKADPQVQDQNYDPWGQGAQQQQVAQQQPVAKKTTKDVWGQPAGDMPDPWAQNAQPAPTAPQQAQPQTGYQQGYDQYGYQQNYQQPAAAYQQPAAKTKDEYGFDINVKQDNQLDW